MNTVDADNTEIKPRWCILGLQFLKVDGAPESLVALRSCRLGVFFFFFGRLHEPFAGLKAY